jgi:hypothetical protein
MKTLILSVLLLLPGLSYAERVADPAQNGAKPQKQAAEAPKYPSHCRVYPMFRGYRILLDFEKPEDKDEYRGTYAEMEQEWNRRACPGAFNVDRN